MGITNQVGASSLIKPGVIDNTAARPASPFEGQVIFQKDTDQLLVWNGTAWVIPNSPAQNPQGLELVTTATCTSGGTASGGVVTIGSAQSSVVIGNAFSSTYNNYRIVTNGIVFSTLGAAVYLKLSGSTGSTYYGNMIYNVPTSSAIGGVSAANGTSNGLFLMTSSQTTATDSDGTLTNPFLSSVSNFFGNYSGRSYNGQMSSHDNNAASSTGFTIAPSSGTMTGGTIRVYGYRNS